MKIKQIPEDFIVEELYDLEKIKEKEEGRKSYFYFILEKKNYSQVRAIEKVARIFNTSKKLINFAGTKDKVGITKGLISIYNLNENNLDKNLEFLNNEVEDINLEYIGKFNGRLNLGDNLGNKFIITIRDLNNDDIKKAKERIEIISKEGILNFFDSQRFGYAGNSHIIGKYILQNNIELALKEVLTSCPKEPSEDLLIYTNFIRDNWEEIVKQNEEILNKIKEIIPKFLSNDLKSIEHIYKYKNDFPGAFKKINKKIRTLYINAYQSYLFNEILKNFKQNNLPDELELFNENTIYDKEISDFVNKLLEKDNITKENFKLKSMPELKLNPIKRRIKIHPKNFEILEINEDELNDGKRKMKVSFELGSGEYATNVIKQLF